MAISTKAAEDPLRRPTRATRYSAGKAERRRVPRPSHAPWTPSADRPSPLTLLSASDKERLPSLVPIRYGRMSISPFTFFRGAATIMAHDLATTPVTGMRVQLCGDAHLGNFGIFGTPERDEVFDANDFDETLPGPWEWDVKRLAASLVVAGRQNRYPRATTRRATRRAVRSYRRAIEAFGRMRYLDVWYFHLDRQAGSFAAGPGPRKLMVREVGQARRQTGLHSFPKMVRASNGRYRIRNAPPLISHYRDSAADEESRTFYDRYRATLPDERRMLLDRYHIEDVVQKVVGVGSVGLACSALLLMGDRDVEDPLVLQLKQATTSALEPSLRPSAYANHAERVVVGQHLVQEASDIFLGWSRLRSRDFYVRQLRDMKFSYDISTLGPRHFLAQAELCGIALARAHARTGDPARISGYLGTKDTFDMAATAFAEAYADQNERDYRELIRAIKKGRIAAEVDV